MLGITVDGIIQEARAEERLIDVINRTGNEVPQGRADADAVDVERPVVPAASHLFDRALCAVARHDLDRAETYDADEGRKNEEA